MVMYKKKFDHHRERSESKAKSRERSRNDPSSIGGARSFNVMHAVSIDQGKDRKRALMGSIDTVSKNNNQINKSSVGGLSPGPAGGLITINGTLLPQLF
jgi:hypothetical protein